MTASSLEPGDPIYPGSHITIDESLNLSIGGEQRLVNHVGLSQTIVPSDEYYWEKESGLLLEHNSEMEALIDGLGFGMTEIHWFNVSSASLKGGEQPRGSSSMDTAGGAATLFAGVAAAVALIAVFTLADRKQRR